MDRRRLLRLAPLLLLAAANAPAFPIREAAWLAPESLPGSLIRAPTECVGVSSDLRVATGRALFGHPLLLGGQAARARLSCASCHRNGRGNPHFSFPGLSGAPGTADVTHALMSSRRGDQRFNPVPIPDLARPGRISRATSDRALERFIRGLIVEEFDGPEPSPETLDALAAYVRAIRPGACPANQFEALTLARDLGDVDEVAALAVGDHGMRGLLIAVLRAKLGAIDERFAGIAPAKTALRDADSELRDRGIAGWSRSWPARRAVLARLERRSLYNPAVLRRAVSAARKP